VCSPTPRRVLTLTSAALVLLIAASARADPPADDGRPLWAVPVVEAVPTAEALASGDAWEAASCLTGLVGLTSGELSRSQPLVWLGRDESALHIGWRVPRLGDTPLGAAVTDRDGAVWTDDAFEVFLDPANAHKDVFQFVVNARGAMYDGRGRDGAWNGAATAHAAESATCWAGIVSVPFADLGLSSPAEGAVFGCNFAVDRSPAQRPSDGWQPEEQVIVWAQVTASLHEPERSGHLVFLRDAAVRVDSLGSPHWRTVRLTGALARGRLAASLCQGDTVTWDGQTDGAGPFSLGPPDLSAGAFRLLLRATRDEHRLAFLACRFAAREPLDLRVTSLALSRRVEVDARFETPGPRRRATVRLSLIDGSGRVVRSGAIRQAGDAPSAPVVWSLADLVPGKYRVRARAANASAELGYDLPAVPDWLGSSAGKFGDNRVLEPWTPLRVLSREPLRLACWGREMELTDGGLLASVRTHGEELLAGPSEWVASVGGHRVRWRASRVQVTKQAPGAVEFVGAQSGGGIRIETHGRLEFDGFMRLDCSVKSLGATVRLDRLELRVPFRREVARLLHHFPRPSVWVSIDMARFNARAIPAEGWHFPFTYHAWVGDEEKGLQWLTDSDQYWRPGDPDRALELQPEGDRMTLRLDLVGRPTELSEPRPYTMAFQASPVKPTPPDYREWRYAQTGWYGMEREPYRWPGDALKVVYPAKGLLPASQGTLEITLTPHFDSQAPDEKNRNLFWLGWPDDRSPEPAAGVWFYWNQDDRGMRLVVRQGGAYRVIAGAGMPWLPGETHTVAVTWGENGTGGGIFLDRQRLATMNDGCTLAGDTDLSKAVMCLGGQPCDFEVRQWRLSDEVLPAEQMGSGAEAMAALPSTRLLDRFDRLEAEGATRYTVPAVSVSGARGEVRSGVRETQRGLDLSGAGTGGSFLDSCYEMGLRTIGFHEQWTDWQGFPSTSHTEELRSLADALHAKGLRLILYHSWQLADIAPEYPLYLRECEIVDPNLFIYTREPKQKDYPVCPGSAWADFMADGMRRTLTEFGIDGVYSDGLAYPGECANQLHGCGYVGEDGVVHPTYNLFAVRDAIKRTAAILEDLGRPTLFVCHTSGSITLPTLSFCDAYLDGEHLTGRPRPFRLPADAFRAEFMGRNFGLPAYFLVYDWNAGMTTDEGLAIALLHDTEVPWSFEAMAPIWNLWSRFGVSSAQFMPYWKPVSWLAGAPQGVLSSMYLRPDGEALIVASNLSEKPTSGPLRLRRPVLMARDALTSRAVKVVDGAIEDTFPVWKARLYWATLAPDAGA